MELEEADEEPPMTLLEALLAQPPEAGAAASGSGGGDAVVLEEGAPGEEAEEELPSAWDPSDWWGEEEAAACAHAPPPQTSSAAAAAMECEALSSRHPASSAAQHAHHNGPELPRPWDPEGNGAAAYHAALSADRLSARYVGKAGKHGQDVGLVKADKPVPRDRDWHYFEVRERVRAVLCDGIGEAFALRSVPFSAADQTLTPLHPTHRWRS